MPGPARLRYRQRGTDDGDSVSSFFQIVIEHHRLNRRRAREFKFFKACMAAAAVVAIADLNACRRESAAVKALVRTLEELRLYDARHGLEIYDGYLDAIQKDPERGNADALEAIAAVKDEPEWAALLVSICATMSEADGVVLVSEVDTIRRIAGMLGIDPDVATAIAVEAGDDLLE